MLSLLGKIVYIYYNVSKSDMQQRALAVRIDKWETPPIFWRKFALKSDIPPPMNKCPVRVHKNCFSFLEIVVGSSR